MDTHTSQKLTPRFFFVSLGVLVSLIASVTSFLSLVFETLNKHFPDALNAAYSYGYNSYTYDSMRASLATLIIVFPVFLILSNVWSKLVKKGLGHTDSLIKKWMLYLVIFLASIVVVTDLVTLVRYFVAGEVTVRFILKVLVVLVTAGLAGYYYFAESKTAEMQKGLRMLTAGIAALLVVAAIVTSFMQMGSPFMQRKLRLDERRMQDLQSIQYQVINFWQQKEKLPNTLVEMKDPISSYSLPVDPEFNKGATYEYAKKGDLSFELCATFALPMPEGWQEYSYGGGVMPMFDSAEYSARPATAPGMGGMNESWDHEAGRTCFSRTIDPDIYPPFEKPVR